MKKRLLCALLLLALALSLLPTVALADDAYTAGTAEELQSLLGQRKTPIKLTDNINLERATADDFRRQYHNRHGWVHHLWWEADRRGERNTPSESDRRRRDRLPGNTERNHLRRRGVPAKSHARAGMMYARFMAAPFAVM